MKRHLFAIPLFLTIILWCFPAAAATYDATGVWRYTVEDQSSVAYVVQRGDEVEVFSEGKRYTGSVSGASYTVSTSFPEDGGTTYETINFTLSSHTTGSGTLLWEWFDGWDYYWDENDFTIVKMVDEPDLNATGLWSYYTSEPQILDGDCSDSTESGYTALVQNGDTFTYVYPNGIHTGRVSGKNYFCTVSYYAYGGLMTETVFFELDASGTHGTGTVVWNWKTDFETCTGRKKLTVDKISIPPTYNAEGKWSIGTSNHVSTGGNPGSPTSFETTISQHGDTFRLDFYGIQTGVISGNNYICFNSFQDEFGYAIVSTVFTLNSETTGTGGISWYWTNGYTSEFGRFDLSLTRQLTTNNPPAQPSLATPANGANVSLAPTLTTGPFSDPDEGDAHRQTEWLISKSDDFLSTVFNQTTAARLNSLEVPWHTLNENTTYYWRVRFYDQENAASAWSETRSFVTGAGKDSNGNGIPDDQEDNDLDQDNDGIMDYLQPHIKSLKVEGKGSLGVSRKDDTTILNIKSLESIDPATISSVFRPHNMPLDLVVANLSVLKPIDGCEAKLYLSEDIPAGAQWFSYNPIHGWRDYTDSVTFSGNTAIIRLKDWGYGDSDGIPNGTIVDPVGYGITPIIKGTILDAVSDQPVRQGFVSVRSESIPALFNGAFWSPIVMGTHQVTASAAGYASETKTLSFNEPAVVVTQDFRLTPIPDVDLADVIIILQVLAGLSPNALPTTIDFNQDNKSGLEDVIYILQKAARLRND